MGGSFYIIGDMKCSVCSSPQVYPYKKIDDVEVYQCRKCLLGFVDPKTPRRNTSHIYDFAEYKKREGQFRKRYEKTVRLLKRYVHGNAVLEVGAGFGLLCSMLEKRGYVVDALEPYVTPHYLKDTKVRIVKKTFTAYAKTTIKKYDAIILYDVIEHTDDPKGMVLLFKKLLKKNGIVLIQTPNYLSTMATRVKKWSWWMIEDHRVFLGRVSFGHLFSKKAWVQRLYTTYEDWIDFKKNLDGNFTNQKMRKYLFFLWWGPFYFLFKKFMWAAGKGGLIVAVYQKK